jgi:WhiB family redox-sensing transcriptional regulator
MRNLLAAIPRPPPFDFDGARCVIEGCDLELFFPPSEENTRRRGVPGGPDRADVAAAKAVCARCDMRGPCLEYALRNAEAWGVFGGTTARERSRIARDREVAAARLRARR